MAGKNWFQQLLTSLGLTAQDATVAKEASLAALAQDATVAKEASLAPLALEASLAALAQDATVAKEASLAPLALEASLAALAQDATVAKEASLAALAQDATVAKEASLAALAQDATVAKEASLAALAQDATVAKEASLAVLALEASVQDVLVAIAALPTQKLLKTGQTTQFDAELDDGYYKKGVAKSYTVLDTGPYSGTENVDLIHGVSVGGDISFINNNPASDTITSVLLDFTTFLQAGDVVPITGATDVGNNRVVTLAIVAANLLTLTESNVLTNRAGDANAITFAKREVKSNNCVQDDNTGLIWLRDASDTPAKMGAASDGKMEWTGFPYDIFAYCAAVNVALVGGYADWRVPNLNELLSLIQWETLAADPAAFPSWPTGGAPTLWTSTHVPAGDPLSWDDTGLIAGDVDTTPVWVTLVRG